MFKKFAILLIHFLINCLFATIIEINGVLHWQEIVQVWIQFQNLLHVYSQSNTTKCSRVVLERKGDVELNHFTNYQPNFDVEKLVVDAHDSVASVHVIVL